MRRRVPGSVLPRAAQLNPEARALKVGNLGETGRSLVKIGRLHSAISRQPRRAAYWQPFSSRLLKASGKLSTGKEPANVSNVSTPATSRSLDRW